MSETIQDSGVALPEPLLGEIRKRIVGAYSPERVILFGSYAEGRATDDSDVDVLVVTRHRRKGRQERTQCNLFHDLAIPVQVVAMSVREFEETRDVIGGLAYPAARYGRVIYEKS